MADALIRYKGLGDILVAGILALQPSIIYDSLPARTIASFTGLHLSSAHTAPGFNVSIACMVAAIGVGHVVAARQGVPARPVILAMNLTWAVLGFLTCVATAREKELGSATLLMSSFNHAAFSLALYLVGLKRSKPKSS